MLYIFLYYALLSVFLVEQLIRVENGFLTDSKILELKNKKSSSQFVLKIFLSLQSYTYINPPYYNYSNIPTYYHIKYGSFKNINFFSKYIGNFSKSPLYFNTNQFYSII